MKQTPILVSACLAGIFCRFDGDTRPLESVVTLIREGRALPFCPETFGGLPTPRPACEKQGDRVMDIEGNDRTEEFTRGAEEGVRLAKLAGCTEAILKSRSPSCGCGIIYDGSFSGTRTEGDGIFAALLKENGISVRNEDYPDHA